MLMKSRYWPGPVYQLNSFDLFLDLHHFVRKQTLERYFSIQRKDEWNKMDIRHFKDKANI